MVVYHINPETGNPGICRADPSNPRSGGCSFGSSEAEHYPSREAAQHGYERAMAARDRFGPQGAEVEALFSQLSEVDPERDSRLSTATEDAGLDGSAAWARAWDLGLKERMDELDRIYTGADSYRDRGTDLALTVTGVAVMLRDRVGTEGFSQADYDLLTEPWRSTIGPLSPPMALRSRPN